MTYLRSSAIPGAINKRSARDRNLYSAATDVINATKVPAQLQQVSAVSAVSAVVVAAVSLITNRYRSSIAMASSKGELPSEDVKNNLGPPEPVVLVERQDSPEAAILLDNFSPVFRTGFVKVGADEYVMANYYREYAQRLESFQTRRDDVFVASHPKTGTTWAQEMVWCIANDLDFVGAQVSLLERFPFLEYSTMFNFKGMLENSPGLVFPDYTTDSFGFIDKLKSPRYIKTHLPWDMLPCEIRTGAKQPKIVYVARNPKDTCLSYYHHSRLLEGYTGTFEDFATLFLAGMLIFSPFLPHVLSYWNRRHSGNVLFIKFADMKKDLGGVIRKTADFLGKTLTDEQVAQLEEHLSFESMSKNASVNYEVLTDVVKSKIFDRAVGNFMRKGEVDEWKATMSEELIAKFDAWTAHHLQGTGLTL